MARMRGFGIAACGGIALLAVISICATGNARGEGDPPGDDPVSLNHGDSSDQSASDAIVSEDSAAADTNPPSAWAEGQNPGEEDGQKDGKSCEVEAMGSHWALEGSRRRRDGASGPVIDVHSG